MKAEISIVFGRRVLRTPMVGSLLMLAILAAPVAAGKDAQDIDPAAAGNLADLSLEALLNIKMTTASRRAKELVKTAGAVSSTNPRGHPPIRRDECA